MPRSTGDLALAAILALLSYAPFEYVAKTTLVVAAALFILDPLPPYSRLVAMLSVVMVGLLNRTLQTWQQGQEQDDKEGEGGGEDLGRQNGDEGANRPSSRIASDKANAANGSTESKKNL